MFDFSEKQLLSVPQSNKAQISPCQTVLTNRREKKFQRKPEQKKAAVDVNQAAAFLI
jgi:hypothetical protein